MKMMLAKHSFGRIILHLVCMIAHGHAAWHLAGIIREIKLN